MVWVGYTLIICNLNGNNISDSENKYNQISLKNLDTTKSWERDIYKTIPVWHISKSYVNFIIFS